MAIPTDYVSFFKFEDDILDEAEAYTAVNHGATFDANGMVGSCLSTTNGYVSTTEPIIELDEDIYSISLWFNISAFSANDVLFEQNITSGCSDCSAVIIRLGSSVDSLTLGAISINYGFWQSDLELGLSLDTWYHLVLTTKNNILKLYIDNVEKLSTTRSADTNNASSKNFFIGADNRDTSEYRFHGLLDELRIYDRELTESEINSLYQNGFGDSVLVEVDNSLLLNIEPKYSRTCAVVESIYIYSIVRDYYVDSFLTNEPLSKPYCLVLNFSMNTYIVHPSSVITSVSITTLDITLNEHSLIISNSDIINVDIFINSVYFIDSISIIIDVNTLFIESICLPVLNMEVLLELNVAVLDFRYIGEADLGTGTNPFTLNKVFAQSIPLTLIAYYLQHPDTAYIQPQSTIINITPIMSNLWVTVHPKSFFIPININSSIAQNNNRDKRVLEIGNVQFDRALYWEKNIKVDEFIATTITTVDGNTVYSIAPLKKYTRSYMISTKSDIIVDITKIEELKETITTDVILIKFTDGSWEHVKFDLTDVSIKFSPIFDGSDKYFLHIGVLL